VAREQVKLGLVRCLKLAVAGMSYRLFRSFITVAILALAVAFLVHMLSFSILSQSTREAAQSELSSSRRLGEIVTRMATPDAPREVLRELSLGRPERISEYRRFAGPGIDLERVTRTARELTRIGRFLEGLPISMRAALLGDRAPDQLWAELADAAKLERFWRQLEAFRVRLPGVDRAQFAALVGAERRSLSDAVSAISAGHEQAAARLLSRYPGRSAPELAAAPPADLPAALADSGFAVDPADVERLRAFSEGLRIRAELKRLLIDSDVRAAISRELGIKLSEVSVDSVARGVQDAERAAWLSEVLTRADATFAVPAPQLHGLLQGWDRERLLIAAAGADAAEAGAGLGTRVRWLIALSFIVCVVGVANAMLMSVTERFTEIATMKCLGAMDGFVMMMFVFEAILQGVLGGVVGIAVGTLLALLRAALDFGQLLGASGGALGELLLASGASFLVGIGLAALAAIGPAWIASRLAPMEAMRVE
jgi:putative ABC transport system permease protein